MYTSVKLYSSQPLYVIQSLQCSVCIHQCVTWAWVPTWLLIVDFAFVNLDPSTPLLSSVRWDCSKISLSGFYKFHVVSREDGLHIHCNAWHLLQWHSQNTADARAQRGHTTFTSSLVPTPHPGLSRLQYGMQKQLGGSGGCSPRKCWKFWAS